MTMYDVRMKHGLQGSNRSKGTQDSSRNEVRVFLSSSLSVARLTKFVLLRPRPPTARTIHRQPSHEYQAFERRSKSNSFGWNEWV